MSDKDTFGKITIKYVPLDENGEKLEEVIVESPVNLLEDTKKLVHILNQKSDSGRGLYASTLDYVNAMVSRKKIPLNATMEVENKFHRMTVKLEDYFSFISSAGNIELVSFGSKENEIGLSWIDDPIDETEPAEVDQPAE